MSKEGNVVRIPGEKALPAFRWLPGFITES